MKLRISTLALVAALGVSSAAFADTQDPLYMNKTGDWLSKTDLSWNSYEYDAGAGFTMDADAVGLSENLSYGVMDDLNIGGTIWMQSGEFDAGSGVTQDIESLVRDIEIDGTYRLLDQKADALTLDLMGAVRANLQEPEFTATSTNEGAIEGIDAYGQSLTFGTRLGKDMGDYTVAGNASVDVNLEGDEDLGSILGTNVTATYDGSVDFNLGVEGQYRFNNELSMNASLNYEAEGDRDVSVNGVAFGTADGLRMTTLGVQGNYQFTDAILGSAYLNYGMGDLGNADVNGFTLGAKASVQF